MPPPSRSRLFFISLSAWVSSLPVELCCYLSVRMRAFFLSPSLFSLIKTAPASVGSAAHTDRRLLLFPYRGFTPSHLISDTHLDTHTTVRTCYTLSPTNSSGKHSHTHTHAAIHTRHPFSNTKHLTSCSSTMNCAYWTQKTQAA